MTGQLPYDEGRPSAFSPNDICPCDECLNDEFCEEIDGRHVCKACAAFDEVDRLSKEVDRLTDMLTGLVELCGNMLKACDGSGFPVLSQSIDTIRKHLALPEEENK